MDSNQHIWRVWANRAHRWGIGDWTATLLEAIGPISVLGAQAVYLANPLLSLLFPKGHLDALANLLEDPEQAQAFSALLREGN